MSYFLLLFIIMSHFIEKLSKLDALMGTNLTEEAMEWSSDFWNKGYKMALQSTRDSVGTGKCQHCNLIIAGGIDYCLQCEEWMDVVNTRPNPSIFCFRINSHECEWCDYHIPLGKSYCDACETWFDKSRRSIILKSTVPPVTKEENYDLKGDEMVSPNQTSHNYNTRGSTSRSTSRTTNCSRCKSEPPLQLFGRSAPSLTHACPDAPPLCSLQQAPPPRRSSRTKGSFVRFGFDEVSVGTPSLPCLAAIPRNPTMKELYNEFGNKDRLSFEEVTQLHERFTCPTPNKLPPVRTIYDWFRSSNPGVSPRDVISTLMTVTTDSEDTKMQLLFKMFQRPGVALGIPAMVLYRKEFERLLHNAFRMVEYRTPSFQSRIGCSPGELARVTANQTLMNVNGFTLEKFMKWLHQG